MNGNQLRWAGLTAALVGAFALAAACAEQTGGGADIGDIAQARGLSEADIAAAVKTYVPTGQMDEYVMFASGGQSGLALVIGIPSLRLL